MLTSVLIMVLCLILECVFVFKGLTSEAVFTLLIFAVANASFNIAKGSYALKKMLDAYNEKVLAEKTLAAIMKGVSNGKRNDN